MAKLSPVFNDQTFDENGNPAVGYKLFTYAAGSSTKQSTFSDEGGATPNSNPIILDSAGWPTQGPIWLTEGQLYKFVLTGPTDSDPPTSPVKTIDNVSGVGDNTVSVSQWINFGLVPVYISGTSFTLSGDQTSSFQVGRRVLLIVGSGAIYGYINTAEYTTLTTVTVVLDSGALDPGLSSVSLGLLTPDNPSSPILKDSNFRVSGSADKTKRVALEVDGLTTNTTRVLTVPDEDGTLLTTSSGKWLAKGIGELYVVDDSLDGVDIPPTDNPLFRYVKLTAGLTGTGDYNEGCLTSESVTGSAPLVIATAVVSLAGSPMLGQTIDLLNTEERVLRAGTSPGAKLSDAFQGHGHAQYAANWNQNTGAEAGSGGSISSSTGANNNLGPTDSVRQPVTYSTYGTPRVDKETRAKSLTVSVYQRIL